MLLGSQVWAQSCGQEFVCKEEYNLTPAYSRFFSKITGNKFLAEKIAQSIIRKNIEKNAEGDFSVKLKSYSARDMKAGRFQSFELNGKNVVLEGVYLSTFNLKTICDFNYFHIDKDWNMTVVDDVPMKFEFEVTQDDLNKTMAAPSYTKILNDINEMGKGFFTISSTTLKIRDKNLYYTMRLASPFLQKTQDVVVASGLAVENCEIKFANAQVLNKNFVFNVDKLAKVLNYINPLDFSVKILENKDARLNIKNVSIVDNKIKVDGTMILVKEVVEK